MDARTRLIDHAQRDIRERGYTATSVGDLCREAGTTKGGFFHHFAAKTDLAIAAGQAFDEGSRSFFAAAPYNRLADPVDRLLGYIAFRQDLLRGPLAEASCLLGTMTQELWQSEPRIVAVCARSFAGHAAMLDADIRAAETLTGRRAGPGLGYHMQAVVQGAIIMAKAGGTAVAIGCLDHLACYIRHIFGREER